ncbi:hypothetical protein TNIN_73361, partial [Trichonephila inaurata madagascariensis]
VKGDLFILPLDFGACGFKGAGCENKRCEYYAVCESDGRGNGKCVCPKACIKVESLVCGTDEVTYLNECEMRVEACRKAQYVMVVSKGPCEFREVPCAGEAPLIDSSTNKEYYCGDGIGSKLCPPGSYCHKSSAFSKCCREVILIKTCSESLYGCCPDGKTSAQGPHSAGCPSVCNCNRLGSYGLTCEPISKQCFCKPGVGGPRCDRCEPGYWGLHRITEESNDGCSQSIAQPVSGSCDELVCFHGAMCRETEDNQAQCICDFKCSPDDNKDLVCGSDGNTYGSECQMKLFSCRYQKTITVESHFPCPKDKKKSKQNIPIFLKRSSLPMSNNRSLRKRKSRSRLQKNELYFRNKKQIRIVMVDLYSSVVMLSCIDWDPFTLSKATITSFTDRSRFSYANASPLVTFRKRDEDELDVLQSIISV